MDRREADDSILEQLVTGRAQAGADEVRQPRREAPLRLIDATVAGQDAMALARVAKIIGGMSPDGRRATLCWLVGYFNPTDDDE